MNCLLCENTGVIHHSKGSIETTYLSWMELCPQGCPVLGDSVLGPEWEDIGAVEDAGP